MDLSPSDGMRARRKRGWHDRADGDEDAVKPSEKRHRPMSGESSSSWHPRDSVISSPPVPGQPNVHKPKYDSDDQSSMMSEPGSPQDLGTSSADEEMEDVAFSSERSPPFTPSSNPFGGLPGPTSSPTQAPAAHYNSGAVAFPAVASTPCQPPPPASSPTPFRTAMKHHMRHRHPQEFLSSPSSSDRLAVPLDLEENNAATPPSASAEATGSQLSMLSFNDMDVEPAPNLPSISINTDVHHHHHHLNQRSSDFDIVADDSHSPFSSSTLHSDHHPFNNGGLVRKQRQRSGALSAGGSPAPPISPSPSSSGHPSPMLFEQQRPEATNTGARRGLSMGFRADCEKCRLRVPGHMNHFVA